MEVLVKGGFSSGGSTGNILTRLTGFSSLCVVELKVSTLLAIG